MDDYEFHHVVYLASPRPQSHLLAFMASDLMFSYCHTAHPARLAPENPTVNTAGRTGDKIILINYYRK